MKKNNREMFILLFMILVLFAVWFFFNFFWISLIMLISLGVFLFLFFFGVVKFFASQDKAYMADSLLVILVMLSLTGIGIFLNNWRVNKVSGLVISGSGANLVNSIDDFRSEFGRYPVDLAELGSGINENEICFVGACVVPSYYVDMKNDNYRIRYDFEKPVTSFIFEGCVWSVGIEKNPNPDGFGDLSLIKDSWYLSKAGDCM